MISVAQFVVEVGFGKRLPQFVNELDRDSREIVDEIERVFDLVRDAGGQLAERGEFLGLHQAVLRGAQVLQRLRQFAGAGLHAFEQPRVLDGQHGLVPRRSAEDRPCFWEFAGPLAPNHKGADDLIGSEQRYHQQGTETGADDDIEDGRRRLFLKVGNLDRHALLCGLANRGLAEVQVTIVDLGDDLFVHSVGCAQMEFPIGLFKHIDRTGLGAGELGCLGDDGGEDGFEIDARIHRLGDFAKCPQFLDRLRKFAGARLHLLEQPHVLDGDHRLIGEGGDQLDLLVGEWPYGVTHQQHDAD